MSMGKVLGGGSSINVTVWARGHRSDWDFIAAETADPSWGESLCWIFIAASKRTEAAISSERPSRGDWLIAHDLLMTSGRKSHSRRKKIRIDTCSQGLGGGGTVGLIKDDRLKRGAFWRDCKK